MNPLEKLADLFERFPGIGPRQANRFVHFLLAERSSYRAELAEQIKLLGSHTGQCKLCYRWFVRAEERDGLCTICSNPRRDASTLFVVEKDADIDNIERSGFRGLYFVLGGTIPLAAEDIEKHIRQTLLVRRLESEGAAGRLQEIILGLSATTEGDHTRQILEQKLSPLCERYNIKATALGRGLSTGSELEYADPDTIASALSSRK